MKLLIATDLSQGSESVIDAVNNRPWPANSEVCILHVVDMTPFPVVAQLLETQRLGAESAVKAAAARLGKSRLKVRTEVLMDYPRSAVPEYARKWCADFVFVGSHGGTDLARFLLGSVAKNVVRMAPCSVELVRAIAYEPARAHKGLRILLATDGSDCSIAAVRSVATRLWPLGTCVKIVSAVSTFVPFINAAPPYAYTDQAGMAAAVIEEVGHSRAVNALAKAEEILREASFKQVERSVPLMGDPKAVILDEAAEWGADLIVVGSHGWRGLDRLMMGSVSESVALHARCSVEVIR